MQSIPLIIATAARHCRDLGARVTIGDSPAFGTAQAIAQATGPGGNDLLHGLDAPVITLNQGVCPGQAMVLRCGFLPMPWTRI